MDKIEDIKNVVCPYCDKFLTAKSFENGRDWICEHCGKLLTYKKFKEYYEKLKAAFEKISIT